ncbi:MAG: hypothetical protein CXT73_06345, partial [Methanobacteriota archaeon]
SNAFKTFFYFIKLKKAINSGLEHDLYFTKLSCFPENQKITLYISQENTLYNFRISNLISAWLDCLKKTDGLFVKPIELKNPYTNIPFKIYNLYNIYFAIKNSTFNMDPVILSFFSSDFEIPRFTYRNFPILKENAISYFIKHGSISELYEETHNMLTEFEVDVDYIVLPQTVSYRRKSFFVNELLDCLRYYCLHAFSCNPLLKRDAKKKCKEKLIDYFKNNDNTSFIRRRPENQPLLPPHILMENNYTPIDLNNLTSRLSSRPHVYYDEAEEVNETEFVSEIHDDNSIDGPSIEDDDEFIETLLHHLDDPFVATLQIPRTPPNNNQDISSSSPFQMNLFRR